MYEKKLKHCVKKLLGLLLLLLPLFGGAQVRYPVSVNGFFVQPRIFISDYLLAGSGNIRAGLRFNDLTEPPREVYLRLSMESATAKLESNPNHWFTPITLSPGELVSLSDIDFAEYLSLDRLLFRGVDKSAVVRSGRLPEGLYTFRLQVLDYRSREVIGSATPFTVMLRLNPPPALIFPRNGSVINCDIAQNVLFQWQLNSPFVTPLNTSYTLALYEVNDDAQLPQAALANGQVRQAYVSEPAAELSRLYSAFEPLLECGKRYTYTITASDADGRDVFKNRGQSEAGWFYYGYPTGGAIPLTYPPNGGAFAISSKKTLRWGGSDKFLPNQPASYHVKMVELAEGDDPEEAMTRRAFLEHSTREGRQPDGGQVDLSGLGSAKAFAWQVKATTGLQEVAQSAVYTFEGAPLVEEFYAGTHLLKVVRGQGSFGSYSGEAEVTLGKDGKTYTIPFKDISLNSSSGLYTLGSDIVVPIPQGFGNITLAAQVERNGEATFFPDSLRVSPDGLALHGRITWAYPFAVDAKEKPYVRTKPTWASFNDLTLSGTADLAAGNTFALLEPMSFTMALDEASRIIFDKNEHRLWFRGHMVAPQSVRGVKEAAYRLYFQDFEQLFYNTVSGYACGNKTYTIPNTNLLLHPQTYTLDLDDTQSAGKLADKPEWQGIYYDRFTVEYPTTLDDMRQVIPAQLIAHRFEEADSSYAYLQASGLMLGIFDRGFGEDEVAGFNCFPSVFNEWRLIVESSRVKSGHLKGSIRLPLISPTLRYPYTVPISPLGLQTGYLDQTLDNTTFEHHPDGGEQHITFTILRAVFADRNRLVLNVDMNYHYLNTTFAGLQGLTIWGRGYEAGFGTPGGTMALTHQQTAMVKGFETTFDHVGAGRNGNLYAVGVSGKMNMGEDVTGVGGAPIANFYSVVENPLLAGVPKSGGNLYENTPVASNEGSGFTPTSDVGVPREGEEVVIDMRIAGFEEKNELLDELSQIAQQYGEKLDVDTAKLPMFEEIQKNTSTSAEQSAITFDQVKQMVDVILAIAEFLDESEDNNPPVIKQLFEDLEDWQIQTLIKKSSTLNEFKADLLKELASKITDKIKEPIEQTEQKAQNFISTKINGLADTAMQPVVALMNEAFEKARPSLLALSPKDSAIINKSITAAKKAIVGNIDKAVKEAVDTEIVGAVNGFIHSAIAGRVYGLVDSIVGKSLYSLAEGQKPDFSNVGDELGGALTGMGQDVVKFVSLDNIGAMLGNTATAAWNNVDMMKIMDDITRELTKQGLNQYVSDQATKAVQGA
ncbi:MAG: hypothetical protein LBK47_01095, partial [Prevotellaceae bacterium]|nr:hypothetical protein [Prevotellaceae bacterium]